MQSELQAGSRFECSRARPAPAIPAEDGHVGGSARSSGGRGRGSAARCADDAKLAQGAAQLQPFIVVPPPECMGQKLHLLGRPNALLGHALWDDGHRPIAH